MNKSVYFLFLLATFLYGCNGSELSQELKPKKTRGPGFLETGMYFINEDSSGVKKAIPFDTIWFFIDPKPAIDLSHFKEVEMTNRNGFSLHIQFDDFATRKFEEITEKMNGELLAFIIEDDLVMAPRISGKITGGSVQISGNFTEDQMLEYYRAIKLSMQVHSNQVKPD
ncbi:MAG: protein-export rane protein SecD, preprotein translocase subunit SecD [Bacteroidetes bacterium]|jgi:hypothetical protein|nr:protein-export rane protein SecD, preprotein translocase subunit SecD [Bacteroidota bacterium]